MREAEHWQMAEDYLSELESGLTELPVGPRRRLVEEYRATIEAAWRESAAKDQAAMAKILDRLGTPEVLAARERGRLNRGNEEGTTPGILTFLAITLFAAPLLVPLAWLPGLVLVWLSRSWYLRDKIVATAISVAGLALFFAISFAGASGAPGQPVGSAVTPTPTAAVAAGESASQSAGLPRDLGIGLATFGLVGAPVSTGLYLGLRLRPRPRRWLVVAGVIAAFIILFALLTIAFGSMWTEAAGGGADMPVSSQMT